MGAAATTVQGDTFAFSSSAVRVVLILGAGEAVTDADVTKLRSYVRGGGTVVLATELGLLENAAFNAFGVRVAGIAVPGTQALASAAFAHPPAPRLSTDPGVAPRLSASVDVLATDATPPP